MVLGLGPGLGPGPGPLALRSIVSSLEDSYLLWSSKHCESLPICPPRVDSSKGCLFPTKEDSA